MKNKFPIFAGLFALSGSYSGLTAQSLQTNILLNEALKKVDTDGEYLQASYVKKDIETSSGAAQIVSEVKTLLQVLFCDILLLIFSCNTAFIVSILLAHLPFS